MPTDIVIPEMGESVRTGVVAAWRKNTGDLVARDEPILDLETDKITMEIVAPAPGRLSQLAKVGDTVPVGAVVARIEESQGAAPSPAPASPAAANGRSPAAAPEPAQATTKPTAPSAPAVTSAAAASPVPPAAAAATATDVRATPVARKLAEEHGVDIARVTGTGAGGRIREQDILGYVQSLKAAPAPSAPSSASPSAPARAPAPAAPTAGARAVRRERMSPLRQRIATRLVEAQHTAAMLTTFNEADMSAVMDLRKRFKDSFEKKHGVGLGFMSFFVKACVNALRAFPAVNASIVNGQGGAAPEIEYHDYCDIAMAVGTPKGLVVPVLRSCEQLSSAQIESGIKDLAVRARDGKLTLDELQGGTFTITNGGIYGSLMSTPILNPPQSGILGMHAIKSRPIEYPVGSGQMAVRPMMYLALSYDHRVIDGAEAVQFLVAVRQGIEEPERLMLGM